MIPLRRKRLLLRLMALGLLAAACAILAYEFVAPAAPTATAQQRLPSTSHAQPAETESTAELRFHDVWEKPLQQVLFDPPPPPPKIVEKPPPPPLNVKLLGTMIDAAESQAIIEDRQQNVFFRKRGEGVTPSQPEAIIDEILPTSINVRQEDQVTTLNME